MDDIKQIKCIGDFNKASIKKVDEFAKKDSSNTKKKSKRDTKKETEQQEFTEVLVKAVFKNNKENDKLTRNLTLNPDPHLLPVIELLQK